MSYHIVDISTTGACISVKDKQLICHTPDNSTHSLPMEDIGAVLINCFSATLHSSFLISAAENKVVVIVCDKFTPVSMVLPVQRATDTMLTRAQIQTPLKMLAKMWLKTVNAKCLNQFEFLERIAPNETKSLRDFKITIARDDTLKEGNCARIYWDVFSRALGLIGFKRLRDGDGLNSLLNYGYAVLLLRVQQKLLAYGLDPLYGMGHYPRERSLPLAYDIMEPFRPVVDEMIYTWVKLKLESADDVLAVNSSYKRYIQGLMDEKYNYGKSSQRLDQILDDMIRGFRIALLDQKEGAYKPWIRRNLKWDG